MPQIRAALWSGTHATLSWRDGLGCIIPRGCGVTNLRGSYFLQLVVDVPRVYPAWMAFEQSLETCLIRSGFD